MQIQQCCRTCRVVWQGPNTIIDFLKRARDLNFCKAKKCSEHNFILIMRSSLLRQCLDYCIAPESNLEFHSTVMNQGGKIRLQIFAESMFSPSHSCNLLVIDLCNVQKECSCRTSSPQTTEIPSNWLNTQQLISFNLSCKAILCK